MLYSGDYHHENEDVLHRQITNSTCIGKLFREFVLTTREGSSAAREPARSVNRHSASTGCSAD